MVFDSFLAIHVRREANETAHRMAKCAFISGTFNVWMEDPTPCLLDVLVQDNLSLI